MGTDWNGMVWYVNLYVAAMSKSGVLLVKRARIYCLPLEDAM